MNFKSSAARSCPTVVANLQDLLSSTLPGRSLLSLWTLSALIWQYFFRWFPRYRFLMLQTCSIHRIRSAKRMGISSTRNSANVPWNDWRPGGMFRTKSRYQRVLWGPSHSQKTRLDVRIHESSYAYSQDWVSLQQTFRKQATSWIIGDRNHNW